MAEPPAHRKGSRPSAPGAAAGALPPDVRTGVRTIHFRANRLANGGVYAVLGLAVLIFLFAAYRLTTSGALSAVVILALAVVLAIWPIRRLGPGRLLSMDTTPDQARLVAAFRPAQVTPRSASLKAVVWVTRGYDGASPRARGLYLVDKNGLQASARPEISATDRLQRYFAAVAIPVELVDSPEPPYPAASGTGASSGG